MRKAAVHWHFAHRDSDLEAGTSTNLQRHHRSDATEGRAVGAQLTEQAVHVDDRPLLDDQTVAEPAGPGELAPLVADAYGLSDRERAVVRLVLQRWSTERIADQLAMSAYTVQDHLKAVFAKMGVSSRKELVAQVFFQQYQPRIRQDADLGPDGWFRTG